jgi:hypothetical protein
MIIIIIIIIIINLANEAWRCAFYWAKNVDAAKDIHKEMLPRAAFLCGYPLLHTYFLPTKNA